MTGLELLLAIILAVVTATGGIISVIARRRTDLDNLEVTHREELESLAQTRKEIIAELRGEMAIMQKEHLSEIARLESQVAELRGQYNAMRNFQVREVIEGVTRGVLTGLGADEELR